MPERNIYARRGRLFYESGDQKIWVGNCTEVSATLKDKKAEGTMTMDQVSTEFERRFIEMVNGSTEVEPQYFLKLDLEDPGVNAPQEDFWLSNVKFWSIPVGFATSDLVTRDIDFTATEDRGSRREYIIKFSDCITGTDTGVPDS